MSLESNARLDRIQSCGGMLIRVVTAGTVSMFLLAELLFFATNVTDVFLIGSAALATLAMLIPLRVDPWATAAGAVSLLATVLVAQNHPRPEPSVAIEAGSLLIVVIRVVWKTDKSRVVPLTALLMVALGAMPLRALQSLKLHELPLLVIFITTPMIVLATMAAGVGLYLRAVDARRARALDSARQGERLELARDLHDFVAHHVTGIVVQAQAARYVTRSGSPQSAEQVDSMLGDIEKAGTEALTSMRRLVGLLREGEGAGVRPVGGLDQLTELVAGFSGPPASLMIDPQLPVLPPEIATTIHRVVQESLTNARKHAADATALRVTVTQIRQGLVEVAVRDNGQGRGRRLPSGRYGLAGLTERVTTCGGTLRAGPRPEGGWEVVAVLPAQAALKQSTP